MKRFLLALIRFYSKCISPCFPARCRYRPTCSAYAYEAIQKYGAVREAGWQSNAWPGAIPFPIGIPTTPYHDFQN